MFEVTAHDFGTPCRIVETVTAVINVPTSDKGSTATLLLNGKVLVAGGYNEVSFLSSAELYDPVGNFWFRTEDMNAIHASHSATLLVNGKVLIAGTFVNQAGSSAELYDPVTGTWASTGSLNDARGNALAAMITVGPLAGRVLVAGGDSVCGGERSVGAGHDRAGEADA